jgi:hypothetical protein
VIAILLDGRNVIANVLCALDIGPQKIMLLFLDGKLLLGHMQGRGKFPTVSRQDDIREHENNHAGENDSLPQCEIASHQVLE